MTEFYVIRNIDNDTYYYTLTPTGNVCWILDREEAEYLTEEQADRIKDYISNNFVKRYHLEIEKA